MAYILLGSTKYALLDNFSQTTFTPNPTSQDWASEPLAEFEESLDSFQYSQYSFQHTPGTVSSDLGTYTPTPAIGSLP